MSIAERFIFQTEFMISVDSAGSNEAKRFTIKEERNMMVDNPALLKNVAIILNAILLRPFEIQLQLRAFYMIRRIYYLYPEYREYIIKPLNLVLSNISVYSVRTVRRRRGIG